MTTTTRRDFLAATAAATIAGFAPAQPPKRLKVAAVFTEFTYRSHAHVILENFLEPYYFNGQVTDPGCDVVSFYADQFPAGRDMARDTAKQYQIPVFPTIADALKLGGKALAVDAVLSIGEHGNYPVNAKGQKEYPRKRFFDEIAGVFAQNARVVPVFTDKHLSYRWDWAKAMLDTADTFGIPLMAGSSVPLAQRVPDVTLPAGAKVTEVVSVHGGGLDSYDFHALEVMQALVEGRAGGETGVARVQYLAADALWKAADAGQWSPALLQAAWDSEPHRKTNLQTLMRGPTWGLLVTYRDGLRGLAIKAGADGTRWNVACRVDGQKEPVAFSHYVGPWRNRCLFKALSHAIQTYFRDGKPPYPLERTLLTTGVVAAGVESHAAGDTPYETPHLGIAYTSNDWTAMRETGASWKRVTEETPEANGIDKLGKAGPPSAPPGSESGFNPIRKQ